MVQVSFYCGFASKASMRQALRMVQVSFFCGFASKASMREKHGFIVAVFVICGNMVLRWFTSTIIESRPT
jgi:hypothetical protein